MKNIHHIVSLTVLFLTAASAPAGAEPAEAPKHLMEWKAPAAGAKVGIIEGLDEATLAALTDAGTLQYFQPRAEEGRWDVVVGMMVHAPADTVWKAAIEYESMCALMPATFDACETVSRDGANARMRYQLHTSALKFNFNLEIVDEITEVAPYHWRLETVDGDLRGRELELLLVPQGPDRTMAFLRYYGNMRSMGSAISLTLALLPDLESPVYASAASYHLRSYKNEAEQRAGCADPAAAAELDFAALDPPTMLKLCGWYAGLIRETRDGKVQSATAFAVMDAPPERVWEVMTDFDRYDAIFPDSKTIVESSNEDGAVLRQSIKQIDVYIFSYSFDLHARYTLEPPRRMSYVAIDGVYQDTTGDFTLIPFENNSRTLVGGAINVMMDRDTSLTMKIVRSGDFPFDAMINLFFARDVLTKFGLEVKRRKL